LIQSFEIVSHTNQFTCRWLRCPWNLQWPRCWPKLQIGAAV